MNASELSRKLLYCGHNDLTDYLRNSPRNRYLYKLMLAELPKHFIDVPIQTLFSEIHYQCVRVRYDGNPGQDVKRRYITEEGRWLNSGPAAELVFSIVWVFFQLRHPLSFNEECFFEQLCPLVDKSSFRQFAQDFKQGILEQGLGLIEEVAPMPCPVKDIPLMVAPDIAPVSKFKEFFFSTLLPDDEDTEARVNPWRVITNNFSRSSVEAYISLYDNADDQMALLERIEKACPPKEYATHANDFADIKRHISAVDFLANYHAQDDVRLKPVADTVEEYDEMFAAGYNQTLEEAEDDKEEFYRQECNNLRHQLGELTKSHEAQLAEREARFKSEIEALEKELLAVKEQQAKNLETKSAQETVPLSKEFSLTITEMASYVTKNFSEAAANEFINMYYHFAIKYNNLDDKASKVMDDVIPAIHRRNAPHTHIDIPTAHQVNISPGQVINKSAEESKK